MEQAANSASSSNSIEAKQIDSTSEPLKGIGGWLVLMALWQIAGPIRTIFNMFVTYTNPTVLTAFEKVPTAAGLELTLNSVYAAIVFFTTYTFFTYKRIFRGMYTLEMISSVLLLPLDYFIISATTTASFESLINPDDLGKVIGASIWGFVMLAYVWLSKRVKNTFVN